MKNSQKPKSIKKGGGKMRKSKKILAVILSAFMIICAFPITSFAATGDTVVIGEDVTLNAAKPYYVDGAASSTGTLGENGCTAYFDVLTNTLSLKNANIETTAATAIKGSDDLIIKLYGDNTVSDINDDSSAYAIETYFGSLTINGMNDGGKTGKLTITAQSSGDAYGMSVGEVTTINNADVTINVPSGSDLFGIYCWNKIEINNSKMNITMGEGTSRALGMLATGDFVNVKNSTIVSTANGTACDLNNGVARIGLLDQSSDIILSGSNKALEGVDLLEDGYTVYVSDNKDGSNEQIWDRDANLSGYKYVHFVSMYNAPIDINGANVDIDEESDSYVAVWGKMNLPETISVNISWGNLKYNYNTGTWNTSTHVYDNVGWAPVTSGTTDKITVTNNSNIRIGTTMSFAGLASSAYAGLTGDFYSESTYANDNSYFVLDEATTDGATSDDAYLKVSGVPTSLTDTDNYVQIGTVTVSIEKAPV